MNFTQHIKVKCYITGGKRSKSPICSNIIKKRSLMLGEICEIGSKRRPFRPLHVILASYLTKEKLLALDKRKYFSVPPNPGT